MRSKRTALMLGLGISFVICFYGCNQPAGTRQAPKEETLSNQITPPAQEPLPSKREVATLTYSPEVPQPIVRKEQAIVEIHLEAKRVVADVAPGAQYEQWTFNGHVPGPFIRVRRGDVLELHVTNADPTGTPHNVDMHAVTGPGGGAPITTTVKGDHRITQFKMLQPGLFVYHCAAPPVMDHIANGMYGLVLVEPEKGLSKVDREYSIMQSEIYAGDPDPKTGILSYSHERGLDENPTYIVFNGRFGALLGDGALKAKTGEIVRLFVGNIGPNKISSFHIIGEIMDRVYREGGLISPPEQGIQTTLIPAGGATVVEFGVTVPGDYTMLDHAIFRTEKGAIGTLHVDGAPRLDLYRPVQ